MKRTQFFTGLLVLAVLPFATIAADKQPGTAVSESSQQKEQYEKSMEERLAKVGRRLDELKAKSKRMAVEARKDLNQYLVDAEKKQTAAARKLETMRKKSIKTWKKFIRETDAALDEFEKAYERAKAHFKE